MDDEHRRRRLKAGKLAILIVAAALLAVWIFARKRHTDAPATAPLAAAGLTEQYRWQLEAMGAQTRGPDVARLQAMQQAMQGAMQQMRGAQPPPPATPTAPAKVEVLRETATSVELNVTLPDGETASGGITFEPNRPYMPTAAELEAHSKSGRSVFGVHLTRSATPDGRAVLSYFVPGNALPAWLRERLYGRSSESAGPQLIRAAWAQGVLNSWTGVQTGYAIGEHVSGLQPKAPWDKAAKNYKQVAKAWEMAEQFDQWMTRLDALEACARNPTHTVTQNAYRDDPAYQQQTLNAIAQARSDVQQATGLNYVNREATVAMQFVKGPGILSETTGKVSDWNDEALKDIGNGLVDDASKLVDCDLGRPPPPLGDGTIVYHMKRKNWRWVEEQEWEVRGTVSLYPGPAGSVVVRGAGEFKGHHKSALPADLVIECAGQSEVGGTGAGDLIGAQGVLTVSASSVGGSCEVGARAGPMRKQDYGAADAGFSCSFNHVDLDNGGTYQVHADGEEAEWALCELEIKPHKQYGSAPAASQ